VLGERLTAQAVAGLVLVGLAIAVLALPAGTLTSRVDAGRAG